MQLPENVNPQMVQIIVNSALNAMQGFFRDDLRPGNTTPVPFFDRYESVICHNENDGHHEPGEAHTLLSVDDTGVCIAGYTHFDGSFEPALVPSLEMTLNNKLIQAGLPVRFGLRSKQELIETEASLPEDMGNLSELFEHFGIDLPDSAKDLYLGLEVDPSIVSTGPAPRQREHSTTDHGTGMYL